MALADHIAGTAGPLPSSRLTGNSTEEPGSASVLTDGPNASTRWRCNVRASLSEPGRGPSRSQYKPRDLRTLVHDLEVGVASLEPKMEVVEHDGILRSAKRTELLKSRSPDLRHLAGRHLGRERSREGGVDCLGTTGSERLNYLVRVHLRCPPAGRARGPG